MSLNINHSGGTTPIIQNKESFTETLMNNAINTITNTLSKNDFVANIANKVIEPVTHVIYVKSRPYIYAGIALYSVIVILLIVIIVMIKYKR